MRENGVRNDSKWPPLALWPYSAEKIFLIRVCRGLRAAPNAAFTSGVVTGNIGCTLYRPRSLRQRPSPLRHGLRRATSPTHFALELETLPQPLKPSPLGDGFPPRRGKMSRSDKRGNRWRVAPDEGYRQVAAKGAPSSVTCGDSFPRPGEAFSSPTHFALELETLRGLPRALPLGEMDANAVSRRRGLALSPQRGCFRRKPALQMPLSSTTLHVKMQCRTARRLPGIALLK